MQMLAGGVLLLALGSAVAKWRACWPRGLGESSLAFVYLVVAGVVGFGTYTWLLSHASPSRCPLRLRQPAGGGAAGLAGGRRAGGRLGDRGAALVIGAVVLITLPAARFRRTSRATT